jgi:hypothetical protein
VCLADDEHPFPNVNEVAPGLMIGHIDKFVRDLGGFDRALPVSSWSAVVTNAYRLWISQRACTP